MKIKNTRELVLRAQAHARADHIKQGTYGNGFVNGHEEYVGCAIGCLSTPHRKRDLRSFLKQWITTDRDGVLDFRRRPQDMVQQLADEFGICPELSRVAESVFENLEHHGAAINFIPDFAQALVEGSSVTPAALRQWANTMPARNVWAKRPIIIHAQASNVGVFQGESTGEVRDSLLEWLRGRKPRG